VSAARVAHCEETGEASVSNATLLGMPARLDRLGIWLTPLLVVGALACGTRAQSARTGGGGASNTTTGTGGSGTGGSSGTSGSAGSAGTATGGGAGSGGAAGTATGGGAGSGGAAGTATDGGAGSAGSAGTATGGGAGSGGAAGTGMGGSAGSGGAAGAGAGGSGGAAGTGTGGSAGSAGSGTGGTAGTTPGDGGTCGCVAGHVGWGFDGGHVLYRDTSALEVCNLFVHQREPVVTAPPTRSCQQPITDCAGAVGPGDVTRATADADVQAAIAAAPVLYGEDPRAYDGQVLRIQIGSAIIEVGAPCRAAPSCKPIPTGVDALAKLLAAITKQELARPPCSTIFPPP
jgi:hypothetical protein